jgi:endonuclease YncB( thermonuclease family)
LNKLLFRRCCLTLLLGSLVLSSTLFAETVSKTVTHVRDGDTIVFGNQPIRLNGIAAPERNEPGGKEASAFMRHLVLGKFLTCTDNGQWTHDRLVAVCHLDGEDIGRLIVAAGLARDCPRFSGGRYTNAETTASRKLPLPHYCKSKK